MPDKFYVKNGWLGAERKGIHYLYNAVDKEFAVFQSQGDIETSFGTKLKAVNIMPDPDFTCETHAAAITLTTKCNMDCPYCYVKPIKGFAAINIDRACEAVHALGEQTDCDLLVFAWGGEPTQNPKALLAMLREAQRYPFIKILLVSNGVIDSDLLKELLKFNNLVFQISFDGLINQNLQKPLRNKVNSLECLLNSMETISQVSRRVALRTTVTRSNVQELKNCLLPTVRRYTNRVILEHLHVSNGRSVFLRDKAPLVEDYVDLVFSIIPLAEEEGIHVKVLPLEHLRTGGPNDKMNFLNILPNGDVVVSNAIIHPSHPDFSTLHIGSIVDGRIIFDQEKNALLSRRYLDNYQVQCQDCFARTVCRGSVQRYLFITHDSLTEWDNLRCQYFMAVIARWMDELIHSVSEAMLSWGVAEGLIQLIAPEGKIHYPMFVMKEGLLLSYKPFL